MSKHLSTKGIMSVIASEYASEIRDSGGTFVLKRQSYEQVMFLNITSSTRRIREFWAMMRMIPGFTALNQNAYAVDVEEFEDWIGLDFDKPLIAQLV